MIKVKLSTPCPEWPFTRQTPGGKGIWGQYEFYENQDIEECDFWVVYDTLLKKEGTKCPPENIIIVTGEPPSVKKYNHNYLQQFSTVVTCHRDIKHPHIIHSHPAQPWHVGRKVRGDKNLGFTKDYDELSSIKKIEKDRLISVISSDKALTEGHRKRVKFVKALKDHFGESIDVFGRGICDVEDKWAAISRYRYHIVLENSSYPDYWTEKLSDAFLGFAYPFYYGCPNVTDYFSADSFTCIDINNYNKSISVIEKCLSDEIYAKSIMPVNEARELVLNQYNLFPFIAQICDTIGLEHNKSEVILKPEINYKPILKRIMHMVKGL